MKKFWGALCAVSLFLTLGVVAQQGNLSADTAELDYDKVSQEAGRNRELLEIWKDHVKTLTKERDDAYRQLEHMRSASPVGGVAQFGGMESAPLPSQATTQQIQGLQSEVSRLQSELERKTTGDPTREMQMQFSAIQRQLQQVKKELSDARAEKDLLIQEKEKALSKVERLENSSSAAEPDARQARELQYENQTLKAHIEKLQVVEKELVNTRGYFTPLVKELQEKSDQLSTENVTLRAEITRIKSESSNAKSEIELARSQGQQYQKENERLAAELDSLKTQTQRVEADNRTAKTELVQIASQIESYKAQLQLAAADRERSKSIAQQYQTLKDQNDSLQKAYAVLEQNSGSSEGRIRELTSQIVTLQNDNRSLAARENGNVQVVEKYKAALAANVADMRNLKGNFEAYLESLVASFEERQK